MGGGAEIEILRLSLLSVPVKKQVARPRIAQSLRGDSLRVQSKKGLVRREEQPGEGITRVWRR